MKTPPRGDNSATSARKILSILCKLRYDKPIKPASSPPNVATKKTINEDKPIRPPQQAPVIQPPATTTTTTPATTTTPQQAPPNK